MNAPEYQAFSYSTPSAHVTDVKHTWTHQLAGELVWNSVTGVIDGWEVSPDFRGRGITELLWTEAQRFARDNDLIHPKHPET